MGQLEDVLIHLKEVNAGSDVQNEQLIKAADRISIDKSLVAENGEEAELILKEIVAILYKDNLKIEIYEGVLLLLESILDSLDFEVIIHILPFDLLVQALNSENENLQILSLKVCVRTKPLDIVANTEIIPRLLQLLSDKTSKINVVSEIESSMGTFLRNQLIRRRVQSEYVISVLTKMSLSNDTVIKTRLLNFMVQILPFINEHEIPETLYLFNDFINDDTLYTLNLIKFYEDLIAVVDENLHKEWLFERIEPQLEQVAVLYFKRDEYSDIELFALGSIYRLFAKISYYSPEFFRKLDLEYIHITKKDIQLLTTVNPSYLAQNHKQDIQEISISAENVPLIRHLTYDPEAFQTAIASRITSSQLLRLPYLEFIAILIQFSRHKHSSFFLLHELPQVMNKLLKSDGIIETNSYSLRRDTLANLNNLTDEELNIWGPAVRTEYSRVINGDNSTLNLRIFEGPA